MRIRCLSTAARRTVCDLRYNGAASARVAGLRKQWPAGEKV